MSLMKINKAVFPVAGMGTRFLPATKANPKEMLSMVDKPLIQYAVEEAIAAGVTELIFVTSSSKRAIEDHFDSNFELESQLEQRGDYRLLSVVREIIPKGVSCIYVRQAKPLGLGHAVLCAKSVVGNEPFAVLLADDLVDGEGQGCLQQMLKLFQKTASSVIAVERVEPSETDKYGIVSLEDSTQDAGRINGMVEKPAIAEAPSNLAAIGRYILTPRIFTLLEAIATNAAGELQLTDAISLLLQEQAVYAYPFVGQRYDCGSKLGYLRATIAYALKHPEIGAEFEAYLHDFLSKEILVS